MEEKKNYTFGEKFVHDGKEYVVEHAKEYKSCHGCAFCEIGGSRCTLNRVENDVPECVGLHRHDGMDVIFVETVQANNDNDIVEFARALASTRYDATSFVGQVKIECFIEGFVSAVGFNFNPR